MAVKQCSVDTCNRPYLAKGLCVGHYTRLIEHGDVKPLVPLRKSHGKWRTPTYNTWDSMIGRCTRKSNPRFPHYGGRGITIHKPWLESFQAFLDDMGERPAGKTLNRIDNDGNYEPSNCEWATPSEQAINKQFSTRNTSGHTGVMYYKSRSKWLAQIQFEGKSHKLGYYDRIEDAITARKLGELKYWGEHARTN